MTHSVKVVLGAFEALLRPSLIALPAHWYIDTVLKMYRTVQCIDWPLVVFHHLPFDLSPNLLAPLCKLYSRYGG